MATEVDWKTCEIKGPPVHEVWTHMETCHEKGLAKNIGVSNCSVAMFIEICAGAKVKPATNQIECNPYLSQKELVQL